VEKELCIARSAIHSARYQLQKWADENVGTLFSSSFIDEHLVVIDAALAVATVGIEEVEAEIYA